MSSPCAIFGATSRDVEELSILVGELLDEIVSATGVDPFGFDLAETSGRLQDFIDRGKYFVFLARVEQGQMAGFISIYESHALYAQGAFGTIAELYVRPEYRSRGVGRALMAEARALATTRDWRRLEVTTPPLPEFDRTLAFYEREGFSITGGRKLKVAL